MRACGNKSGLLAVVTEGALERTAIFLVALNHTKRASDHAIRTAITYVGLHIHTAEFCAHNGARRTSLETPSILAMLTDIRREAQGRKIGTVPAVTDLRRMLYK